MQWSIGRGALGQIDEIMDTSWADFCDFLSDSAQVPRNPTEKDSHWWITPMIPTSTKGRTLSDIDHLGAWIGLDVDRGHLSLSDIRLQLLGTPCVAHSTTSATIDEPKWRIIIQVDRPMTVNEHARVWQWFASKFNTAIDYKTRNANRIFYLPAYWDGGLNIYHVEAATSKPANVDSILAMVPQVETLVPEEPEPIHGSQLHAMPANERIISRHMLDSAIAATPGGRLYHLLCQAAKRARLNGWDLNPHQLAAAGTAASNVFAPGKKRPGILREAEKAIHWANAHFQPESPIQRMRNRILWERTRR